MWENTVVSYIVLYSLDLNSIERIVFSHVLKRWIGVGTDSRGLGNAAEVIHIISRCTVDLGFP